MQQNRFHFQYLHCQQQEHNSFSISLNFQQYKLFIKFQMQINFRNFLPSHLELESSKENKQSKTALSIFVFCFVSIS